MNEAPEYLEALRYAETADPIVPAIAWGIDPCPIPSSWRESVLPVLGALYRRDPALLAEAWPTMWHGGVGGLEAGERLLPPVQTGARNPAQQRARGFRTANNADRFESVFVAIHPAIAAYYAYFMGGGALYRVATPPNLRPDTHTRSEESLWRRGWPGAYAWSAPEARIVAVERPVLEWTDEVIAAVQSQAAAFIGAGPAAAQAIRFRAGRGSPDSDGARLLQRLRWRRSDGPLESLYQQWRCALCAAKPLTRRYHVDALCWIADCATCGVPMVVAHGHQAPSDGEAAAMLAALESVGGRRYGVGGYAVDTRRRAIPDHWHAHARPPAS